MITRLKRRFIALAMTSLTALLAVIIAGMNIINYNTVVSNADSTLDMLSKNKGSMPMFFEDGIDDLFGSIEKEILGLYGRNDDYDDIDAETGDYSQSDRSRKMNRTPHAFSRDEAEETRYFTVLIDGNCNVIRTNTDRISAVDSDQAAEYAVKVASSGSTRGFVDDYRYAVITEGNYTRVTFLDCGRTLDAFREFLRASINMSLIGLIAVFGVICYFASRIVRPVAESYEKQKRFITDAGHEIKTPLAIIKANIDVMQMDLDDLSEAADPDEQSEIKAINDSLNDSLTDIGSQVDRLTSLTNDLVYLSRMEEGGAALTMTEIPVSDIVSETAESFYPLAVERKKDIEMSIDPMLSIQGSTKEIEKLVSILVENALKYSPEGDTIQVSLHREGKNIDLEVKNKTVSQISDEDLEHVFDRFYRTDKSRNSEAGGHGIGLSMASAIVAAHGGKIRARSGDGTEFIVTATMPAIN